MNALRGTLGNREGGFTMATETLPTDAVQERDAAAGSAWAALNLTAITLLGALLLFQVQPIIGKFILPWFGGCPAVWTTCMLFFQVMLFGGYAFAHGLTRWTPPRWQPAIHLALIAAAVALLPIAQAALLPIAHAEFWKPTEQSLPTLRILLLLTATVGLPYFALSATSPLTQVWFSRSCPGRSPYRLYAVSNFGSLAVLLSYPFLVEPAMTLPGQSWLWSGGFVLYAVLCAAGAVWMWRLRPQAAMGGAGVSPVLQESTGKMPVPPDVHAPPTLLRRALWVLLPACGRWSSWRRRTTSPGRGRRAVSLGCPAGAVSALVHPVLRPSPLVRPQRLGDARLELILAVAGGDWIWAASVCRTTSSPI